MEEGARNIREAIERYVPGISSQNSNHGFETLAIQLFGLLGHGKSSLINSCMCVVRDTNYENLAGSGNSNEGKTKKRNQYRLTDTIMIADNRGFCMMNDEEILEVCAQIRYLRPLDGQVDWKKDNAKETVREIRTSYKPPQNYLLPVIVHSSLSTLSADESMNKFITKCYDITGIPPIVVLTKAQSPNPSPAIPPDISTQFAGMGVVHIVSVENYTELKHNRSPEADKQFLNFIDLCLKEAERGIRLRSNQPHQQIFAKCVADQTEEERELYTKKINQLQEENKKLKERRCCIQ